MKPDKNTCLNCGKEISSRAKYCSDKCRKAYGRNPDKKADKPNPDTENSQEPEQIVYSRDVPSNLTKTDKTFYERAMKDFGEPYYNFDGKLRDGLCGFCQAKFKTNLSLNKYCSYEHYKKSLSGVVK